MGDLFQENDAAMSIRSWALSGNDKIWRESMKREKSLESNHHFGRTRRERKHRAQHHRVQTAGLPQMGTHPAPPPKRSISQAGRPQNYRSRATHAPEVYVEKPSRPQPARVRGTGYGPPTSEFMASRVGTGPVTWDKAPGTWGGSNPGYHGAKSLPLNRGDLGQQLRGVHETQFVSDKLPAWRHPTRTGCLMSRPPAEFEPPLVDDKVNYQPLEAMPETSASPRKPFSLVAGLPDHSRKAADERNFNSFWYGTEKGDQCNHDMALNWCNFSLSLR